MTLHELEKATKIQTFTSGLLFIANAVGRNFSDYILNTLVEEQVIHTTVLTAFKGKSSAETLDMYFLGTRSAVGLIGPKASAELMFGKYADSIVSICNVLEEMPDVTLDDVENAWVEIKEMCLQLSPKAN